MPAVVGFGWRRVAWCRLQLCSVLSAAVEVAGGTNEIASCEMDAKGTVHFVEWETYFQLF